MTFKSFSGAQTHTYRHKQVKQSWSAGRGPALLTGCLQLENTDSRSSQTPRLRHNRPTQPSDGRCLFLNLVRSAGVSPPSPSSCGSFTGCRLELGTRRWFGGGHDLHVLREDGLEGFVSVNHGAKHQRLKNTNGYVSIKYL